MQVRTAILKAANRIESRPKAFQFWETAIPKTEARGCGCALGWIGHYLGYQENEGGLGSVAAALRVSQCEFYNRLARIEEEWIDDPAACARVLRAYARKHDKALRRAA